MKIDPTKTLAENVIKILMRLRRGRSLGLRDWEQGLLDQAEAEVKRDNDDA